MPDMRASVTIVDDWNVEAATYVYATLDSGATLADVQTSMTNLAGGVDKVTGGKITGLRVTVFPTLPSRGTGTQNIKTDPVSGDEIGIEGLFDFYSTGTIKRWAFGVPALAHAQIDGGVIVLTTTSPAQLLVNQLLATATTGLTNYNNANQQPLSAFSVRRIAIRKHRKQTQSKSTR